MKFVEGSVSLRKRVGVPQGPQSLAKVGTALLELPYVKWFWDSARHSSDLFQRGACEERL